MPHPPHLRVMDIVRKKLEQNAKFEVVDYQPMEHEEGLKLIVCVPFACTAEPDAVY